jgi:hypothetical protein
MSSLAEMLGGKRQEELGPLASSLAYRGYLLPLGRTQDGKTQFAVPGIVDDAINAFKLPHDVMTGDIPIRGADGQLSDEAIGRSFDLAGMMTLGAGAIPAEKNSLRAGIKAYHGSPHDFDKFDLSKIGTGEGAQVYGHGLYFAENKNVAQSYKNLLSKDFQNTSISNALPEKYKGSGDNARRIVNNIRQAMDSGDISRPSDYAKVFDVSNDMLPAYSEAARLLENPGHMYEVNINADPNSFLDWDKPLSQQGQQVQEAATRLGLREAQTPDGPMPVGADLRRMFNNPLYAPQKMGADSVDAVSQGFAREGIPGIKYLDQGSRGAGEGSRNYVVFDPKIIDIVKKYGIVGALGMGAITKEQAAQMQEQGM